MNLEYQALILKILVVILSYLVIIQYFKLKKYSFNEKEFNAQVKKLDDVIELRILMNSKYKVPYTDMESLDEMVISLQEPTLKNWLPDAYKEQNEKL